MKQSTTSSFGSMLQRFRQRRKLSQQKLAERVGRSRESISLWERGLEYPDTRGIMLALAEKLLLDEEEKRLPWRRLAFHQLERIFIHFLARMVSRIEVRHLRVWIEQAAYALTQIPPPAAEPLDDKPAEAAVQTPLRQQKPAVRRDSRRTISLL